MKHNDEFEGLCVFTSLTVKLSSCVGVDSFNSIDFAL